MHFVQQIQKSLFCSHVLDSLFLLTLSFLMPLHSSHMSHSLVPSLLLFPFLLSLPFCHRQVGTSRFTDVLTFSSAFFLSGLGVFPFIPGDPFSAGTRDIPHLAYGAQKSQQMPYGKRE